MTIQLPLPQLCIDGAYAKKITNNRAFYAQIEKNNSIKLIPCPVSVRNGSKGAEGLKAHQFFVVFKLFFHWGQLHEICGSSILNGIKKQHDSPTPLCSHS